MKNKQEFQQQFIEKAMKDPDFRKRLLEIPKTVIEEETGVKIPEGINVNVMEEDMGTIYLALPFVPAQAYETELAETELESIAGGTNTIISLQCSIFVCYPTLADPQYHYITSLM